MTHYLAIRNSSVVYLKKNNIPEVRNGKVSCLLKSKRNTSHTIHGSLIKEVNVKCFDTALDNMISGLKL